MGRMMENAMEPERITFHVGAEDAETRIDLCCAGRLEGYSRAEIQRLIRDGYITLNGHEITPHYMVREGHRIEATLPPPSGRFPEAEPIPLDVMYEDDDLLVINKVSGMIVHPAGRILSGTLVNALRARCDHLSSVAGDLKPGIVHRLDKGTSGCIVVAKNDEIHEGLAAQFAQRTVEKIYRAIVRGNPREDSGTIEKPLCRHPVQRTKMAVRKTGGRPAETGYEVIERFDGFSYLKLHLKTGRTHQIRVHMAHVGHPVAGEFLYGKGRIKEVAGLPVTRPLLHAWRLGFIHPRTAKRLCFEAELPADFMAVLNALRAETPLQKDNNGEKE